MRKVVLVSLIALLALSLGFGQVTTNAKLETLTPPGSFIGRAGLGWGGVSGGAELMFSEISIAKVIPITFGLAGRAFLDPGLFGSGLIIGGGGLGTMHFGFKALGLPEKLKYLENIDSYFGLGLGIGLGGNAKIPFGIGICNVEGTSYYLNKNLAINVEFGWLNSILSWDYYFSTVGIVFSI